MTRFDEAKHSRDRTGKFSAQVGAEQPGSLVDDEAVQNADPERDRQRALNAEMERETWQLCGFDPDEQAEWSQAGWTDPNKAAIWANEGHSAFEASVYDRDGLAPDATFQQRHESLEKALYFAKKEERTFQAFFDRMSDEDQQDLVRLRGDEWNGLHDRIRACEQAIVDVESEQSWSKVDPNTRWLVQNNMD